MLIIFYNAFMQIYIEWVKTLVFTIGLTVPRHEEVNGWFSIVMKLSRMDRNRMS